MQNILHIPFLIHPAPSIFQKRENTACFSRPSMVSLVCAPMVRTPKCTAPAVSP